MSKSLARQRAEGIYSAARNQKEEYATLYTFVEGQFVTYDKKTGIFAYRDRFGNLLYTADNNRPKYIVIDDLIMMQGVWLCGYTRGE